MRVSRAEKQLLNGLRNEDTRRLMLDVIVQHIEGIDASIDGMLEDPTLAEQDYNKFNEVFGQAMLDKAALLNLLEDLNAAQA